MQYKNRNVPGVALATNVNTVGKVGGPARQPKPLQQSPRLQQRCRLKPKLGLCRFCICLRPLPCPPNRNPYWTLNQHTRQTHVISTQRKPGSGDGGRPASGASAARLLRLGWPRQVRQAS